MKSRTTSTTNRKRSKPLRASRGLTTPEPSGFFKALHPYTGRRFVYEDRRYTPAEHKAEWQRRIKQALSDLQLAINISPSFCYTAQVAVTKDDSRFEHAPIVECWSSPSPKISIKKPRRKQREGW